MADVALGASPNWYLSSALAVHPRRGARAVAWACHTAVELASFAPGSGPAGARAVLQQHRTLAAGGHARVVGVAFVDDRPQPATGAAAATTDREEGEVAMSDAAPEDLGLRLAVADSDGHVALWLLEQGVRARRHAAHKGARVQALAASWSTVASGDSAGRLALWDVTRMDGEHVLLPATQSGPITALAFAAHDGCLLAIGYHWLFTTPAIYPFCCYPFLPGTRAASLTLCASATRASATCCSGCAGTRTRF